MTGFVRASRLYDVETGDRIRFDWRAHEPIPEQQAEIECRLEEIEGGGSA